ncbi:MAG: glycosyltransferase family 39 protein [Planctomycetota bacterium]|jgi:hypothetical protein|nr:glycosyltransferase family 39 protein [Planctomycetota bacterium]MDP6764159.1 glycosyltransferase family 39 protein [Planctomycetota bacterium]MDP6989630.1 glycosyltransferase family 39 protein [Planctomycetota bacterium]
MTTTPRPRAPWIAGLAVLFVLPLFLRVGAIDHGQPRNYVPDTHAVRAALGMARDLDPVPPVGRYSTYPNLMPYLLAGVYGGHFAWGALDGSWSGPAEFGEAVTAEPAAVHLLARLLVALFGALTPWLVLRAAREAGLGRGAWVAAWLVGVGVLHVHYSVQERPWVPMVFFMALALRPAAAYAHAPRARALAACGASCGLAFATHQAGLPALGIAACAWLVAPGGWSGADLRRRLGHGTLCVALFGLVALLVGHPYLLVHGATPDAGVVGGAASDFSVGGQGILLAFRFASIARQLQAAVAYDPALWILAAAGLGSALRARRARPAALFALAWAGFFMSLENDHVRYLLPLAVLLAIPAGFAAQRLAAGGLTARLALLALLASPLVESLRLVHVLGAEDTRAEAERLLEQSLPDGALLAIDRYGPAADLSLTSLERLGSWRALSTREAHRRNRLAAAADTADGLDAVRLEDLLAFDERAGTVELRACAAGLVGGEGGPRELLVALGVTHLLLVDRSPAEPDRHALAPLVASREPVWVIDPSRGSAPAAETRLPTDLRLALADLWRVDRPGPWMGLYDLR